MIKSLHHVAIAVKDLDETVKFYQEYFRLKAPVKTEVSQEEGVKTCFLPLGNTYLAVVEPIDPNGGVGQFVAREGERIHHVCLETENVAAELKNVAAKGVELIDSSPRRLPAGMSGFINPNSTRGVLVELTQAAEQSPAPASREIFETIEGLHHVAFAVKSLDETVKFYQETFGLGPPVKTEIIQDQGVKACLISTGNAYIELLEPVDPNSTVARFIEREGEKIHHICLQTENVDEELRRMSSRGMELVDRVPRRGLSGMIGFLHPRSTRGVLIELCQPEEGRSVAVSMAERKKLRILIAKPGLDGHDRGAKIVARALRDAGMEVIYTGIRQSPDMIAEAALQEDVDAVGLSILSGAHMELCPRVVSLMKEKGMGEVPVFLGGIIPEEDIPALKNLGIKGVFGPGTTTIEIVDFVKAAAL